MKKFLLALQKGERITVNVIEVQNENQILVSYHGELFRVKNTSARRFDVGDRILLVVNQRDPLEFSLAGEGRLLSRLA